MTDARKLLEEYHFDVLKDMAELLRVPLTSQKKAAYIEALSPLLFTPQTIERGLSLLGLRERQALATLQRAGGRAEVAGLRLYFLRQGIVEAADEAHGPYSYSSSGGTLSPEGRRTTFVSVIGRLMATGLVCGQEIVQAAFSNRVKIYYDNVRLVYIPDEVRGCLPDLPVPQPAERALEQLHVQEGSARAFQRDLYFYWSTAHTAPLSLTKDERLYRRDLRLVNDALLGNYDIENKDEPDCPRLLFLRLLLHDLGLLTVNQRTVYGVDHPPFLGQSPATRIEQTFTRWRDGAFWNELLSVPRITVLGVNSRLDPVPPPIARARKSVLDHVTEVHRVAIADAQDTPLRERWVPINRLIDSLRIADYGFLFPRNFRPGSSTYYTYYGYSSFRSPYISYGNEMGWSISPRFDDEAEGWEVVEAGFVRVLLLEPMHWMGLVDLGFSGDRLVAYRLTQAGEWVLGIGEELVIPQGEGKVIVQPNFEMVALDPISDLTLSKLDEFADRVNAERAITYRLSRESVYRAQRRGWTTERILETLAQMSDSTLPQNVARTLQEWQTIHERIKVYRRRALLQAKDGDLLDRLIETPRIRARLSGRPDQDVALIVSRPGETEELVYNLQEIGYPPARTRSAQDRLRPSFTIDENGHLVFTVDLPSIYLYQQIAPFTGQDEQGRYFLTQSAVQEAIAGGMGVTEILSRLRAVHLGPLPRWVEIKVRAWGHYYGDAAVQALVVVQIEDEKTLHELLAEPELDGLLHPFAPAAGKALAFVEAKDLDALRQAFRERNIDIADRLD